MRSKPLCEVDGCEHNARRHGKDCRKHYKLAWQREKRKQKAFEESHVYMDDATYALNDKWYREWYQRQD